MALGAQRKKTLWSFVGQGVRWTPIGGCIGVAAALTLVRFMRSILFEIIPYDPKYEHKVLFAVAAIISAATRSAKIDPMVPFRNE
jgi:ABC-type lipoprotein release transport system permease subunit